MTEILISAISSIITGDCWVFFVPGIIFKPCYGSINIRLCNINMFTASTFMKASQTAQHNQRFNEAAGDTFVHIVRKKFGVDSTDTSKNVAFVHSACGFLQQKQRKFNKSSKNAVFYISAV